MATKENTNQQSTLRTAHVCVHIAVHNIQDIAQNSSDNFEVDLVGLKPILRTTTSFSALTLLVGSFDPQKPSPK